MSFIVKLVFILVYVILLFPFSVSAQEKTQSAARKWNEVLLYAIKNDFARPTVHARNLFHISMAMYDAWAAYENNASTYFLNHNFRDYYTPFKGIVKSNVIKASQEEAISYAAYRILSHRFRHSPAAIWTQMEFDNLFEQLGYDASFTSTDYTGGSPAALGNYIAEKVIDYGFRDGANENIRYQNKYYLPSNGGLNPFLPGNGNIRDPNLWQPLELPVFIDQGGTPLGGAPPFLTPEWGKVIPFALKKEDLKKYHKGGNEYWVYHDPGAPPMVNKDPEKPSSEAYKWAFSLVPIWAAHLDPTDGVMIDISPASRGNVIQYPVNDAEMKDFYNLTEGGDSGKGYNLNPYTGAPYESQVVPRGDYARVLAEFWADGPNSETPPGHWFSILNHVSDHPLLEKRIGGKGEILNDLEWDVKTYFALGGALHDAAITAWGIKGYYDYVRPISAVRYMAEMGQSSDINLPRYHPSGIPLVEGFIELVKEGDPLYGLKTANLNKIKLYTWRGHDFAHFPEYTAGAGWILAEDWWPYQSRAFVTPPFAGYISGHSTFSRAAAEVMSMLTGDEYFPGGMSEFHISKNEYLLTERGPGVDIVLQWAKYKDASDQCSLSRIWGGIHPPIDDIPGRIIGEKIGKEAFFHASHYFNGSVQPEEEPEEIVQLTIYPNPLISNVLLKVKPEPFIKNGNLQILNMMGQVIYEEELLNNRKDILELDLHFVPSGIYTLKLHGNGLKLVKRFIVN